MKRLVVLALLSCGLINAGPLKVITHILGSKFSWGVSVGAFGAAEMCDYRSTIEVVSSGAGVEENPLLINPSGNLVVNRLVTFKLLTFVLPVSSESYLYLKMNAAQRKHYGRWMTLGNWTASAAIGVIAAHNRSIYQRQ